MCTKTTEAVYFNVATTEILFLSAAGDFDCKVREDGFYSDSTDCRNFYRSEFFGFFGCCCCFLAA